ncbi:MAG: hypothetical protein ACYCW6_03430 [Candidatus Xenobia bacterium]
MTLKGSKLPTARVHWSANLVQPPGHDSASPHEASERHDGRPLQTTDTTARPRSNLTGATSLTVHVRASSNTSTDLVQPVTVPIPASATQVTAQVNNVSLVQVVVEVDSFNGTTQLGVGDSSPFQVQAGTNTVPTITVPPLVAAVPGHLFGVAGTAPNNVVGFAFAGLNTINNTTVKIGGGNGSFISNQEDVQSDISVLTDPTNRLIDFTLNAGTANGSQPISVSVTTQANDISDSVIDPVGNSATAAAIRTSSQQRPQMLTVRSELMPRIWQTGGDPGREPKQPGHEVCRVACCVAASDTHGVSHRRLDAGAGAAGGADYEGDDGGRSGASLWTACGHPRA